jgi:hypothetical protein
MSIIILFGPKGLKASVVVLINVVDYVSVLVNVSLSVMYEVFVSL